MAWLLPEFFIWIFSEYSILAGIGLLALPGIGWMMGKEKGDDMMERAEEVRQQAEDAMRTANEQIQWANETQQALGRQRIALDAMEEACDEKNRGNDVRFIDMSCELPLDMRIKVSLRVGAYPSESEESYQRRRQALIDRRVQEWRVAKRFGQFLLPLAEEQRGLCGNPKKDPSRKGCGAYLYNFPPTAVHIDHIRPQSKGGSDDHTNFQALCSYCNTRAGNRT